ncbi:thiamine-binding protein [candidate division WOR-3 bacterium]|uniref:Thiamine-binding protein n=1 Tax=candidate division WOR-3 bacterium TaxID=2052148 RepID=A0A660SLE3_UNCW3|nr:MAG: thiamine-binding protein [candidate division WOR-3 bacterium]
MAVVQFSVVPIGTGKPSVSEYVVRAEEIIRSSGIKHRLTPMATVLEGDLDRIVALILKVHNEIFKMGVERVITRIDIDDRRDKELTMEGKIRSVETKL